MSAVAAGIAKARPWTGPQPRAGTAAETWRPYVSKPVRPVMLYQLQHHSPVAAAPRPHDIVAVVSAIAITSISRRPAAPCVSSISQTYERNWFTEGVG